MAAERTLTEVVELRGGAELQPGEIAVRVGCALCPKAVCLEGEAPASDVLGILNSSSAGFSVKAANEAGNAIGWDRSAAADCDRDQCAHPEQLADAVAELKDLAQ